MKQIRLTRDLWNHMKGETMEVEDSKADWAEKRKAAVIIEEKEEPKAKGRKKKIDPEVEGYKTK
jgi:hypothetical protein